MAGAARTALLALMLLVMALPLAHTLAVRQNPLGPLASPRLGKVVFPLEPEWTLAGWMSGDFQRRADRWFSNVVEPRGWVIPLTNQLLHTVFARSYMGDRTIVIGRRGELYQGTYIAGYCEGGEVGDARALAASADRAGELNARLAGAGIERHPLPSQLEPQPDAEHRRGPGREPPRLPHLTVGLHPGGVRLHARGGNIDRVKQHMVELADARKRQNSTTDIHVLYHRYKHNLADERPMRDFAQRLGLGFHPVWAFMMPLEKILAYVNDDPTEATLTDEDHQLIGNLALPLKEAIA